jgi:hypothetical protein
MLWWLLFLNQLVQVMQLYMLLRDEGFDQEVHIHVGDLGCAVHMQN